MLSSRAKFRSAATVVIDLHYFRLAPPPGETRTPKALFNAHAAMRSFMMFPNDNIAIYLDWRTQEVGVAAALPAMNVGRRLRRWRYLSRAGRDVRPHQRHQHQALEVRAQRTAPADEGAATGHFVRHGCSNSLAKGVEPSPANRQRSHHPASTEISTVLAVARRDGATRDVRTRQMETDFDGWPLHLYESRTSERFIIFRCKVAAPRC